MTIRHMKFMAIPMDHLCKLLRVPAGSIITTVGMDAQQYILQLQVHHPSFDPVEDFSVLEGNVPDFLWKDEE